MPAGFINRRILTCLALVALAGCASTGDSIPAASPSPTSPAITQPATVLPPTSTSTPPTVPTPTPLLERLTQYDLSAVLDYWGHSLSVVQQIDFTNNSPDSLNEIILIVEPLRYNGTFTLDSLEWSSGAPINPTYEGEILRLPLSEPLAPGESIGIALSYTLNLHSPVPDPSIRPIPFGYTARQTNLVDWYPFIPPYLPDQGWLANPPSYYGEHLAYEIADFTVRIKSLDATTPLVIAASAPASQEGDWQTFRHEAARNFVWSASHEYQTLTAQAGPVTVTSYFFPVHARAGQAALQTTLEALELYARLYGPYQHSTLSVVEADFLDGMEYDGLYFLSNGFYNLYTGTPAEYLVAIAAHETAHQWFYARLGNDQANEPWLDEALCTYSERLYYENIHPEALNWWWAYRINYYNPHGWVDTSVYNLLGDPQPYSAYRAAVYFNGALFLENLRKELGDQTFFETLKEYLQQNSMQLVSGRQFFDQLPGDPFTEFQALLEKYFSSQYIMSLKQ